MKQLALLVLAGILASGLSEALEHSALSDTFVLYTGSIELEGLEHSALSQPFMLDTRANAPQGLQHSALSHTFPLDTLDTGIALKHHEISNQFALDTRQSSDVKLLHLDPDPNPSGRVVMSGGVGYLYYQVVDGNHTPILGMAVAYNTNGLVHVSPLSDVDGIVVLPVDTTELPSSGTSDVVATHVGPVVLEIPIKSQVEIIPRSHKHTWELGSAISEKVGLDVGRSGYVKGRTEAGIAYMLDESGFLTITRTAELGVGTGLGVRTPGVKLSLGAIHAKAIAEASVAQIPYASFSDEYLFDEPQQREQQTAQLALLLDTAMRISGQTPPLALHFVDALARIAQVDYNTHRTMESVALGVHYQAAARATVGVPGQFSNNGTPGPSIKFTFGEEATLALAAEVEHIRYYAGNQPTADGYALHQELDASLDLGTAFGVGSIPDKDLFSNDAVGYSSDYISAKAGARVGQLGVTDVFAQFGMAGLWEFREEYIVKTDGQTDSFLFSMGDRKKTITYIVQGEDIEHIQQSVANLVAFLNISDVAQDVEVRVGMNAIVGELRSLIEQLVTLDVSYVVTEKRASGFELPIELAEALGLDVDLGFRLDASECLEQTTLEGVFLGGRSYPLTSYADGVSSQVRLPTIIDDALQNSWDVVKGSFRRVHKTVKAQIGASIGSTAVVMEQGIEVVKGTAQLTTTFTREVGVTLITWFRASDEPVTAAPASNAAKYQQSLASANTPVLGGYYQFAPEGEVLAEPGELTITYTDEEARQLGVREEALRISYWDPDISRWVSVGGIIDTHSNRVTTTVTALHLYAITFDVTPPIISQHRPMPDAIVTDPGMSIGAHVMDDTNQLDVSSLTLLLDATEVPYLFDGELVRYASMAIIPGKHTVTLRVSDVYGNATEETWSFTLRNPSGIPWDVNGDGIVDILDLVAVGTAFGTTGNNTQGDVNADGTVDILDLVMIGTHFGEQVHGEVSAAPQLPDHRHTELLEGWLIQARAVNDDSATFQSAIALLEQLLVSITPEKTAFLPNYPNPFNPETWFPYQLSEGSEVTLTIYDALGRIVRHMEVGYQPVGMYRSRDRAAYWDGRNEEGESIASGAYFVEFEAGGFRQIRPIVLLR